MRSCRAVAIALATVVVAGPRLAAAQTFDFQKFARDFGQLPDVVVDRVGNVVRKARGVGIELERTRYEFVPQAAVAGTPGATVGWDGFSARVNAPIPIRKGTSIIGSISYDSITFRDDGFPGGFPADRLHEIHWRVAFLQSISERWRFMSGLDVGLLRDFGNIQHDFNHLEIDDFQGAAIVLFEYELSKRASVAFGAGYSTTFGLPIPLPAGKFSYDGDHVRVGATIPSKVEVGWLPWKELELGARVSLAGSDFHLVTLNQRLAMTTLYLGPYVDFETVRGLTTELQLGVLPWRRLRLDTETHDEIRDLDPKPTWFFRAEIAFAL